MRNDHVQAIRTGQTAEDDRAARETIQAKRSARQRKRRIKQTLAPGFPDGPTTSVELSTALARLVPGAARRFAMERRRLLSGRAVTGWAFLLPGGHSEGRFGTVYSIRGIVITEDGAAYDVSRASPEPMDELAPADAKNWVWRARHEVNEEETSLMFAEVLRWLGREADFWPAMREAGLAP